MGSPDQVTGIVLPTNGKLVVGYQATWQETVAQAARAAIFVGATQLLVQQNGVTFQAARTISPSSAGVARPLASCPFGLVTNVADASSGGDLTTGQVVGMVSDNNGLSCDLGGVSNQLVTTAGSHFVYAGGPCAIFAAAGTYTVSVQFKASSGSVTASNRKLWVEAKTFA